MREISQEIICYETGWPREQILSLLRGHVFHVTKDEGYQGIMKDGMIKHNQDGQFSFSYPQSKNNWGRMKGYVSLNDLRNVSDKIIEETQRYELLTTNQYLKHVELIISILEDLTNSQIETIDRWDDD